MAQRSAGLWSDGSAQTLVEYALLIAILAIGLTAAFVVLRNAIGETIVAVEESVRDTPGGCKNPVPSERNPNCS